MRILLVGNPNVGKSSLFSRMTGTAVLCSNYPGTTVSYCSGKMSFKGGKADVVDTPGLYSMKPQSPAEKVALDMLSDADIVINVVDATNLERSLYLTLEVLETGHPTVVALNMADDARHLGVRIDTGELERMLQVPVVETVALTGQGVKELVESLEDARKASVKRTEEGRWAELGRIVGAVQTIRRKKHTIFESLEDATVRPLTGIPFALAILYLTFMAVIGIGNFAVDSLFDPFFRTIWVPAVRGLVGPVFPSGLVHDLLLGRGSDLVGGLGVLTTGFYVPLALVLPYVVLFYMALSVLEDTGYLPRLATLADNLMHRLGLHGSAIVPSVLGLGCRVPGVLATRMLETRKQRLIAATLVAVCVPCLAQNAVVFGLLSKYGMEYVLIVYATLAISYLALGLALNLLIGGESPEMLLEIPPYRKPDPSALLSKTWARVRYFLSEAVPYILLGVAFVNVLYISGAMAVVSDTVGPVMSSLFGLPREASVALIVGFLRKDFAVGMLAPIPMTPMQLTVACILLVTYMPCLATLTVLYRELGARDFIKSMAAMLIATVAVGIALKALLL